MSKLPTLYIPHGGGPCFFMDWTLGPADTWDNMANWLRGVLSTLPIRPDAFLIISAHWETSPVKVTSNPEPELVYDYYGFPEHTYGLTYPANGAPELAAEVVGLLADSDIEAQADSERGLDHGVFVPFKLIAPDADIPVVQLSLSANLDPDFHIKAGQALAPLREKGVCIVGSGLSSHNLKSMMRPDSKLPESLEFNDWLVAACAAAPADRNDQLAHWEQAPGARLTHPREEHLLPLMVCAGAAGEDIGQCVFSDDVLGVRAVAIQFG